MLLATRGRRTTETMTADPAMREVRRSLQDLARGTLPDPSGPLAHSLACLHRRLNRVRMLGGDLSKVEVSPQLRELLTACGIDASDQSAVAQRVEAAPFTREGERAA